MAVITKWLLEVGRPWQAFSGRVEKADTQASRNPTGANEIATTKKARFAHAHLAASGTYASSMETCCAISFDMGVNITYIRLPYNT